jgi:hypothetical protein
MITIDYDVRDRVPPILESDIDRNLVLCWTDFRTHDVIYYAIRNIQDHTVSFRGFWLQYPHEELRTFSTRWNRASTLINLMINKITDQYEYQHIFYVVENETELRELIKKLRIINDHFVEEVSARFRWLYL